MSLTYPFVTTKTEKKPTQVVFDASWLESEKGNTMVTTDDGALAAWIHVAGNVYLEVTDTPGNSPRFYVTFIEATPAQLKKAIRKQCEGWYCVRWNVTDKAPIDEEGCIA